MQKEEKVTNYKFNRKLIQWTFYLLIIAIIFLCIAPYLWIAINSFKPRLRIFSVSPFVPFKPTLKNYEDLIAKRDALRFLSNSAIIATGSTIIAVLIGIPAAYGFSRFRYFGKQYLLIYMLATTMVPPITIAVPMYILFRYLGMIDTHLGMIMADGAYNVVFTAWLMKGFFDEIPKAIEEAAMIDGCSQFMAFRKITLPLGAPGVTTIAIFSFIFSWNDLLYALILTGDQSRTLTVSIPILIQRSGTLWGEVCGLTTMQTLPIIIISFFTLKYLVRGLTFGAVKG